MMFYPLGSKGSKNAQKVSRKWSRVEHGLFIYQVNQRRKGMNRLRKEGRLWGLKRVMNKKTPGSGRAARGFEYNV